MGELADFLKLIPEGTTTAAVIFIVILFLKQQEKYNSNLEQITQRFNEQTTINQKAFQEQINILSQQYYTNQKSFQDQIQLLIDAHMKVSRDMISSLKSLESAVNIVKEKLSKLPDK